MCDPPQQHCTDIVEQHCVEEPQEVCFTGSDAHCDSRPQEICVDSTEIECQTVTDVVTDTECAQSIRR